MKRVILFVEGEGDALAAPRLVRRKLTELNAWDVLYLDENAFRVDEVQTLVKDDFAKWKRLLAASQKRPNTAAVLLILDGDVERLSGVEFCAASVARRLAE